MFSENHKVQMQDFLRKKLLNSVDGGGVHIDRDEVETVGAKMGLDPDQAAQLFESIGVTTGGANTSLPADGDG